nr:hypothetical protein [Lachnospiraceae bacterium]
YNNNLYKNWRGFVFDSNPYYWIDKGNPMTANIRLNDVNEKIINLIYAINGEFTPSSKYRYFYLFKQDWLPEDFVSKIEKIYCFDNFSEEKFHERFGVYNQILDECIERCDELNLLPENIEDYYSENFSRFNDNNLE